MARPRIPPMLNSLIQSTITGQDGAVYSDVPICSGCHGELSGYDSKTRLFARIRENGEKKNIHVIVTRYQCRGCGRIISSPAPFYPDTRLGIPVVDLCRALSAVMPSTRAARTIAGMGILVDPASIRSYSHQFRDPLPTVSLFGYPIPLSLISLVRSHGFSRDRSPVAGTKSGVSGDSPAAGRT